MTWPVPQKPQAICHNSICLSSIDLLSSMTGLFFCMIKRPSFFLNKLIIRWITFACIATIAFMWFGGPRLATSLSLGPYGFEYPQPSSALAPHLERPSKPPPQPTKEEQDVWEPRKNEVRNAFKHAWSGYKSFAYPNDELLSISGGTSNKLSFFSFFPFSFFPLIFFFSFLFFFYKKV